jgi:hypothetical protein
MFQIIQEAVLPKLSQTSLYSKFDEKSGITDNIKAEIKSSADNVVPARRYIRNHFVNETQW